MRIVVFQHLACEHPGIWRDFLREDGADVVTVELDAGDTLPSLDGADALLVFGGPMNVDEHDRFPWLAPETASIREAALGALPVFGVCLGAQLLARALGAPVTKNPSPEVGLLEVELTAAGTSDPLFEGWPRRAPVVQWHSDTFALPPGATLLATSPACRHQAFRHGRCAYGLQFHPEVTADMVEEWGEIPEYAAAMRRMQAGSGGGPFAGVPGESPAMARRARLLYRNFMALVARQT
ncbi:MAG TPA: type 1 glutamine amidotransferase [Gemmatimonadales bacterium]|nr:type 1 glutamine amidotransferase [Gemmatimonadales bacterium]